MFKRGVVYLKENECPKCRGKLVLISVERSITPLNQDGIPVITTDIDDDVEVCIACKKCGETYEAEKKGLYFTIKKDLPQINNPSLKDFNPFLL